MRRHLAAVFIAVNLSLSGLSRCKRKVYCSTTHHNDFASARWCLKKSFYILLECFQWIFDKIEGLWHFCRSYRINTNANQCGPLLPDRNTVECHLTTGGSGDSILCGSRHQKRLSVSKTSRPTAHTQTVDKSWWQNWTGWRFTRNYRPNWPWKCRLTAT